MDPDEALRQMRELVNGVLLSGRERDWKRHAATMAEQFHELDDWLTRGGFPPDDWTQAVYTPEGRKLKWQIDRT